MISKKQIYIVVAVVGVLLLGIHIYTSGVWRTPVDKSTATTSESGVVIKTRYVRTPDARIFTARRCPNAKQEEFATITLTASTTLKQCIAVKPLQKLRIVNDSDQALTIGFSRLPPQHQPFYESISVISQGTYDFDKPFNQFLDSGMHRLQVSGQSPVEIFVLKEENEK